MRGLLVVIVLLLSAASAEAATIHVTKTDDSHDGTCDADCSLREAIDKANADGTADTIELPAGVYRIEISGASEDANATDDLDIAQDLTITGAGPAATTIHSYTGDDRVLDVLGSSTDVTLNGLTVSGGRNGYPAEPVATGGGIRSNTAGDLTLQDVVVRDNAAFGAASYGDGGGLAKVSGRLLVTNALFTGNRAAYGGYGGAIYIDSLTDAELTNVTVTGNSASSFAGGLFSSTAIPGHLVHVTVAGNEGGIAGGLGGDVSALRLRSSIVAANTGTSGQANCGTTYAPASDGGNVGDGACGLTTPTDIPTNDPQLGPLAGTAIGVLEPLAGSPAVDHATGDCPATDARGVARPQGPACDAGAAERPVAPAPAPPTTITQTVITPPPPPKLTLPASGRLRSRSVRLVLKCAAGPACGGTARLSSGKTTLGSRQFAIRAGKRATITIKLSRSGRKRVHGRRRLAAKLTIRLDGVRAPVTSAVRLSR